MPAITRSNFCGFLFLFSTVRVGLGAPVTSALTKTAHGSTETVDPVTWKSSGKEIYRN